MYTVAGTQAENTIDNHIVVSKAEPENYEEDAKISFDTIPHQGAVNRIRVDPELVHHDSVFPTVRRS